MPFSSSSDYLVSKWANSGRNPPSQCLQLSSKCPSLLLQRNEKQTRGKTCCNTVITLFLYHQGLQVGGRVRHEKLLYLMNNCLVVLFGSSLKNSEHIANALSISHMPPRGSWRSKTHFTDPEIKAASNLITFLIPKQVLRLLLSPSNLCPTFFFNKVFF